MQTSIFKIGLIVLSLLVSVLSCFDSPVDAATTTASTQLTNLAGPQLEPRPDGKTVVWADYRNDPVNHNCLSFCFPPPSSVHYK